MLSEPRLKATEINVLTNDGLKPLKDVTPLANALKRRQTPRWVVLIASPAKYKEKIKEIWKKVIFG